ncbi:MAG: hypothetical protein HY720_04285 [Planctomycetes bacterium]|nr:hypothetical protein [Planctomycetota bacterium]
MEEVFGKRLVAAGLLSVADLKDCRDLVRELTAAGLSIALPQVVVKKGLVEEAACRSIWKAAGGSPMPDLPEPDPDRDRRAQERVLRSGALSAEGLDAVRSFMGWAAERGLRFGLAEILVRRGFLPEAELTSTQELPPPLPVPLRRPPTRSSGQTVPEAREPARAERSAPQAGEQLARAERRRGKTDRAPAVRPPTTGRHGRGARPGRSKTVLIAGITLGAAVPIIAAIVTIASVSGPDRDAAAGSPPEPKGLDAGAKTRAAGPESEAPLPLEDRPEGERPIEDGPVAPRDRPPRRLLDNLDEWQMVNTGPGSGLVDGNIVLRDSGSHMMSSFETKPKKIELGPRFRIAFEFQYRFEASQQVVIFLFFAADLASGFDSNALLLLPEDGERRAHIGFARRAPEKSWDLKGPTELDSGPLGGDRWHRFEVAWDEGTRKLMVILDSSDVMQTTLEPGDVLRAPWGIGMGGFRELRIRGLTLREE